jgi:beta-1,4-mannosyltransferase
MKGMFTQKQSNGKIIYKEERPVLLITSTSYTPDEDIGLLVEALAKYVNESQNNPELPRLHLVVTGAGP